MYHTFIKVIILLYNFLVIYFALHKGYMICLVSCSKCSDVLPALTCARAIGNLSSICLRAHILRLEWSENLSELKNLYLQFLWEIFCCQKHKELFIYHRKVYITVYIFFLLFFLWILRFYFTLKVHSFNYKSLWSSSDF